jgi:hypothetical protein
MTPELEAEAIFTEVDQLQRAIGASGTSVVKELQSAGSAGLAFQSGTGKTVAFDLSDPQPVNYSFSSLVDPTTDLTEPTTYHLTDASLV